MPLNRPRLRIGFVPNSDSELMSGLPLCKELRRRGHQVRIALDPANRLHEQQAGLLRREDEQPYPLEQLRLEPLDLRLYGSLPLRGNRRSPLFYYETCAGVPFRCLHQLWFSHLFSRANFSIFPAALESPLQALLRQAVPVIGFTGAEILGPPARESQGAEQPRRIVFPDSPPLHPASRRRFFRYLEQLARTLPGYRVAIKERFATPDAGMHFAYAPYSALFNADTPGNLELLPADTPTYVYLRDAWAVIGIYSGAMLQSLLNGIPTYFIEGLFDTELCSGMPFSPNPLARQLGVSVPQQLLADRLRNPELPSPERIRAVFPHLDASAQVANALELIFTVFAHDARLPWITFPLPYTADFETDLVRYKERLAGATSPQLDAQNTILRRYALAKAEVFKALGLVNPWAAETAIVDALLPEDCHGELQDLARRGARQEAFALVERYKARSLAAMVERLYSPENLDAIFSDRHTIEASVFREAGGVLDALYRAGRQAEARRYQEAILAFCEHRERINTPPARLRHAWFVEIPAELRAGGAASGLPDSLLREQAGDLAAHPELTDWQRFTARLSLVSTPAGAHPPTAEQVQTAYASGQVPGVTPSQRHEAAVRHSVILQRQGLPDLEAALLQCAVQDQTLGGELRSDLRYRLATALKRAGRIEACLAILEALLTAPGQDSQLSGIHFHQADAWAQLGHKERAAEAARACLALCPEHRAAAALLQRLQQPD